MGLSVHLPGDVVTDSRCGHVERYGSRERYLDPDIDKDIDRERRTSTRSHGQSSIDLLGFSAVFSERGRSLFTSLCTRTRRLILPIHKSPRRVYAWKLVGPSMQRQSYRHMGKALFYHELPEFWPDTSAPPAADLWSHPYA